MAGDVTARFRAGSTLPYVWALRVLAQYSWDHDDTEFDWGPLNVSAVRQHGITVSGPEAVVGTLTRLLERDAPGLYRDDQELARGEAGGGQQQPAACRAGAG